MSTDNPYASPQIFEDDFSAPHEKVEAGELASRSDRLVASTIDGFIMMAIFFSVVFAIGFGAIYTAVFVEAEGVLESQSWSSAIGVQVLLFIISVGIYLVLNGYLLAAHGQTIGKRFKKIKIVCQDGSHASLSRLIGLRLLPFWLVGYIPFGGFVHFIDVLLIFQKNRLCLHDNLASTVVVKAS